MPDYKEEQLTGRKWARSDGFVGTNLYQKVPTLRFSEEVRKELGDGTQLVYGYGQGLSADMTTPEKEIVLRNPQDDSIIPDVTMLIASVGCTYTLVQVLLYSLYRQLAIERDESGIVPNEYPKNAMMGMIR